MKHPVSAILIALLLVLAPCSYAVAGEFLGDKSGRISLVDEFIRELVALDAMQQLAAEELTENSSSTGQVSTVIRASTRVLYEMMKSIGILEQLKLGGTSETFRKTLISLHRDRISALQEMIGLAEKMPAGPEPSGKNKAMARMAELSATVEHIDKALFTISQGLFSMLIDIDRLDENGHVAYLIVTSRERQQLIRQIGGAFGSRLEDKNANYVVSSASLFFDGLNKDFKSSDEK